MHLKSLTLFIFWGLPLAVNAAEPSQTRPFATGQLNTVTDKYFSGESNLQWLNSQEVRVANVTFEPGCRNKWHIYPILLVTSNEVFYQEWAYPLNV